jgi:nucleotide-binding universal stress UspA family protein
MTVAEQEVTTDVRIEGGVLVGQDGSKNSSVAVAWAARTADRLGLPLHVLRAWTITTAPTPPTMTGGYVPPLVDFEQEVVSAVKADLADLDLPETLEVHVHAVRGKSSTKLLEAAENADLLVVGTRGGGGFRGLGFGSTADQVVRHAPCPVVVVPTVKS